MKDVVGVQLRRQLRRMRSLPDNLGPRLRKFGLQGNHTFFGYYDVTPFSKNNQLLLAVTLPPIHRTPQPADSLTVGYFDLHFEKRFRPLGDTTTWCWQQGCRLRWHPTNENELITYNRMLNGGFGAVVQDVHTGELHHHYRRPFYDIDSSGKWALSLNFSRLQRLRPGYGYINLPDETQGDPHPNSDGLWLTNLLTGSSDLILSLASLAKLNPLPSMNGAEHYINHISFSPSGSHFMFFHLWNKNTDRYGRLIVCKIDGSEARVLEDRGRISHYCWKSDRDLLVTVNVQQRRFQYNLYQGLSQKYTTIGRDVLTIDGHPSYSPDGTWLLTDTYPDKYREQRVLLYSIEAERLIELGKFMAPFRNRGEYRCDLHPRWDRCGRYVCIDSAHEGCRALYLLEIE